MYDPFLGLISLFPYTFAPQGWALCDGRTLTIASNQALFALLGARFGGDGKTTFAVPNLIGAEPIPNTHYYIALQGIFPTRE